MSCPRGKDGQHEHGEPVRKPDGVGRHHVRRALRPHSKVTIISEFHALRLAAKNDLWYLGGGAFQPWSFGYVGRATNGARSLANLYDTGVEVRVNPRFTLAPYFGFVQGRAVMSTIYPTGTNAMLGYMEVNYRF